ncbi:alpha/beta hydrolase [Segetibacter aerophilus]|uniref:Phospholipase/carboxylesterase n=1 Tax=Segetibacter aerophilus TaxID=670293 RepID=A0A512B8J6_9BACT|nr:dienelactone hydrolase family protein [Segetibacter aerophilus]GEO08249.1 phospholipase/carboxylesterase [Segetibacter aerophilus]
MHQKNIVAAGKPVTATSKVLVMLHGRGGSAEDILGFATHLHVKEFSLLAPEATNNTWYPYSFLVPPSQNEPWLSSALKLIEELVDDVLAKGVPLENIYFCGFSQGACLALEFVARNAKRYGGVAAFTGGLIGDKIYSENYKGDFEGTPIFIGTSNPDPHVPVARVNATTITLRNMNAAVTEKVYNNMGHTINEDEIERSNKLVFKA